MGGAFEEPSQTGGVAFLWAVQATVGWATFPLLFMSITYAAELTGGHAPMDTFDYTISTKYCPPNTLMTPLHP